MLRPRALVIGAGACGLQFAEALAGSGLQTIIIDDKLIAGGIWQTGQLRNQVLFNTLRSNLPMQGMCLRPSHSVQSIGALPSFPSGTQLGTYLQQYASNSSGYAVWYSAKVEKVRRSSPNPEASTRSGASQRRWSVTVHGEAPVDCNLASCVQSVGPSRWETDVDFVAFCGGHYSQQEAAWPCLDGLNDLRAGLPYSQTVSPAAKCSPSASRGGGIHPQQPVPAGGDPCRPLVIHSSEYPGPELLRDRRTLVIGGGSSGADIARDAAVVGLCYWARSRTATASSPGRVSGASSDGKPVQVAAVRQLSLDPSMGRHIDAVLADATTVHVDAVVVCTGYKMLPPPVFEGASVDQSDYAAFDDAVSVRVPTSIHLHPREPPSMHGGDTQTPSMDTASTDDDGTERDKGGKGQAVPKHVFRGYECNRSAFAKCISPLTAHLICSEDPSLCIGGLPMNVMPWPLFRDQADLVAALWSGRLPMPTVSELAAFREHVDIPASRTLISNRTKIAIDLGHSSGTGSKSDGSSSNEELGSHPWHFLGPAQFHYREMLRRLSAPAAGEPGPGVSLPWTWESAGRAFLSAVRGDKEAEGGQAGGETRTVRGTSSVSRDTSVLPASVYDAPTLSGQEISVQRLQIIDGSSSSPRDSVWLPSLQDSQVTAAARTAPGAIPPRLPFMSVASISSSSATSPLQCIRIGLVEAELHSSSAADGEAADSKAADETTATALIAHCQADVPTECQVDGMRRLELDRVVYSLCGAARAAGETYRSAQFLHVIPASGSRIRRSVDNPGRSIAPASATRTPPLHDASDAGSEGSGADCAEPAIECACVGVYPEIPGSSGGSGARFKEEVLPRIVIVAPVDVIEEIAAAFGR